MPRIAAPGRRRKALEQHRPPSGQMRCGAGRAQRQQLYEDVAISAAEALGRILQNEQLAGAVGWPAGAVEAAQAGRRRVRFDGANESYQRLEIVRQDDKLRFLFPTDKARAEETLATGQFALTGNTVLIAGTDLIVRTTDAEDIFTFLDGRLAERFIRRPEEVGLRLGAFEWQPDVEGRYRVNECYCHDTTWQQALAELLRVSDVVLMDLRNFVAANKGCLYELQTLSAMPALSRVVVLVNAQTELAAAQAATSLAPEGRFVWLRQPDDTPPAAEGVLARLLA